MGSMSAPRRALVESYILAGDVGYRGQVSDAVRRDGVGAAAVGS